MLEDLHHLRPIFYSGYWAILARLRLDRCAVHNVLLFDANGVLHQTIPKRGSYFCPILNSFKDKEQTYVVCLAAASRDNLCTAMSCLILCGTFKEVLPGNLELNTHGCLDMEVRCRLAVTDAAGLRFFLSPQPVSSPLSIFHDMFHFPRATGIDSMGIRTVNVEPCPTSLETDICPFNISANDLTI